MKNRRILLTGAAGRLGTVLRPFLCERWQVRSSDIREPDQLYPGETFQLVDLSDRNAVAKASEGCDAIVHFGGIPMEAEYERIQAANIEGTYNLFDAARQAGVERVVFASTHHVVGYVPVGEATGTEVPVRPDGLYATSKVFGEGLGRLFFERYGLRHFSLRIGMCVEKPFDHRSLGIWLSYRDLCHLVERSLVIEDVGFAIHYGISSNSRAWLSNADAPNIGYRPDSDSEVFANEILANNPPFDPNDPRQARTGGYFTTEKPPFWEGPDMKFTPSSFN